ncbi:unnamed protein product [Peniophora sp. CBMAI 1063]|nr:unnamed protein product [Peniophora sp. CBMAI 1063]
MTNHGTKNTSDAQFKKTHQEVGRPETTDHSLNDEFFNRPPQNIDTEIELHTREPIEHFTKVPKSDADAEAMGGGVNGDEGKGRPKHDVIDGQQIQDSSVHA